MLTPCEQEELDVLQQAHRNNSLGDRPHAMAASKLLRLMQLERKAQDCAPSVTARQSAEL